MKRLDLPFPWPWGYRAIVTQHGVGARLSDDHPVEWWVCCRLDEPWTWRVLTNQHVGACIDCAAPIIYRISEKSPHADPAVKKICVLCADRRRREPDEA